MQIPTFGIIICYKDRFTGISEVNLNVYPVGDKIREKNIPSDFKIQ